MLLLSLLVDTGQLPGTGLTQADKTCIQLNFYLDILKGEHLGFKVGGGKSPPAPPPLNATLQNIHQDSPLTVGINFKGYVAEPTSCSLLDLLPHASIGQGTHLPSNITFTMLYHWLS